MSKSYWLMKSEEDVWSIDQQIKTGAKSAPWDGVRNYHPAKPRWPLDEDAAFLKGAGVQL